MRNRYPIPLAGAFLSLWAAITTGAFADDGPIQDPDAIRQTARQFALGMVASDGVEARVEAAPLDRRLRLPACDRSLAAFASPGGRSSSRPSIGVRCDGSSPWSLYVPVTIERLGQVVVTVRPVARGQTLTAEDLKLAERDLGDLHNGYLTSLDQAVGQRATRDLPAEAELASGALSAPTAIKRGAEVTIVASDELLDVRMRGIALAAGAVGQRIRVRNATSKRELDAIVLSEGLVQAGP
jgi:flagella basal body P-ring formation protein FlgA